MKILRAVAYVVGALLSAVLGKAIQQAKPIGDGKIIVVPDTMGSLLAKSIASTGSTLIAQALDGIDSPVSQWVQEQFEELSAEVMYITQEWD